MVGFGSSLRIARRSGWEEAYLDYETLKLLLSQIEAVYEEEGLKFYSQQNLDQHKEREEKFPHRSTHLQPKEKSFGTDKSHDYRKDLFLENNSDEAYGSLDDDDGDRGDDDYDEDDNMNAVDEEGLQNSFVYSGQPLRDKNFPLPYNFPNNTSQTLSDREIDKNKRSANGCFSCCRKPTDPETKILEKNRMRWTQNNDPIDSETEIRSLYARSGPNESNAFFLASSDDDVAINMPDSLYRFAQYHHDSDKTIQLGPSVLNAPTVRRFLVNESTTLLNPPQVDNGSFYSFQPLQNDQDEIGSPTKQQKSFSHDPYHQKFQQQQLSPFMQPQVSHNGNSFTESSPYRDLHSFSNRSETPFYSLKNPDKDALKRRYEREYHRDMRRKRRKKSNRNVPRHIRIAHAKARAIMERFLGLLRAETEKVLLFAHSRLGELADTTGSLRFPSLDEEYGPSNDTRMSNHQSNEKSRHRKNGSYYPLADGGMHPSASSSSDEGGSAWSEDSGSEDDKESLQTNRLLPSHRMQSPAKQRPSPYSEDLTEPFNRPDSGSTNMFYRKSDPVDGVCRQLAHFAELRKCRSVFRRNDQILGEDMLFLSAVEEADGYTAVGVELMHVLKYINVNLIAVRKICRKHDRLLMQRMVGFYYKKVQSRDGLPCDRHWHSEDAKTLGGLVARVSGEVYEAHPALFGQMNHFKLVGVYDTKIQNLAKSKSVEVISSCLALALSEFEVARSRASALNKLNSTSGKKTNYAPSGKPYPIENIGMIDSLKIEANECDGPPSTASIVSLTRLRFTVVSIFALREAARYKTDAFMAYLSRSMLTFTGSHIVGEGLDGCSRATLDFLVAYNPDAALLFDTSILFEGIKRGQWTRLPMDEIMISTLAVASSPSMLPMSITSSMLAKEMETVANAVSVVPESKSVMLKRLIRGQFPRRLTGRRILAADDVPKIALVLNRMSCFLFMMNYYVYHSTTLLFVESEGYHAGFSAILIGIPNLSAILVTLVHCYIETKEVEVLSYKYSVSTLRSLFLMSAFMAVLGNAVHALAIAHNSVPLAILGRFIFGFSSAEVLHRHLVAACMPSHFLTESARLMLFRVCGATCGLIMGSVSVAIPKLVKMLSERTLQAASWMMSFFWIVHFIRIILHFRPRLPIWNQDKFSNTRDDGGADADGDSEESQSSSSEIQTPSTVLFRKSSDSNKSNDVDGDINQSKASTFGSELDLIESTRGQSAFIKKKNMRRRSIMSQTKFLSRIHKFILFHVAIPTTLAAIAFATFATEILFTGTPIITEEYFGWSGAHASTYLGCVTCLILPIHFLCELVARRYEERIIIKRSFVLITTSILIMLNWRSLYSLAHQVKGIFADVTDNRSYAYDWWMGKFQFCVGMVGLFSGLVALEGAALSLLSKISPINHYSRSVTLNVGTIVSLLGFASRLFADMNILLTDVSQKLINTDVINSFLIPMLLCSVIGYYVINKHFFFLM